MFTRDNVLLFGLFVTITCIIHFFQLYRYWKTQSLQPGKVQALEDLDAKPSDAKPSDAKPSDAKPSDAKPSDAKPSDAKPSDAKPPGPVPVENPEPDKVPVNKPPAPVNIEASFNECAIACKQKHNKFKDYASGSCGACVRQCSVKHKYPYYNSYNHNGFCECSNYSTFFWNTHQGNRECTN